MERFEDINPGLKAMLDKAEELEWSYDVWIEESRNSRTYAELERYSPAGEDFSIIVDFEKDHQVETFLRDLREYYENFDVDDHVEMWMPSRGENGCPSSIKALVEDAEAIESMILELLDALEDMEVDCR
jgi:hypothetical protein